ncbi:MAG: hypothetical protein UX85_C0010G0012 [Candidatus Beckwithbacteria bacterium GW2011_GWB1_47_15]|uniref:Integral membrane protein n=1 Tax=Candidatus Beckwithbacteria bacterium GW2011_GWB1_47_15 TaxID=1618371 RepID=A0A0G1RT19_9BACT|nr:MAG: Uncharacterized protein UY43_C0001G0816 [Candidatus Beckwithbacteria bacterium GW2011_GWC1_49_16]AQS30947.1 hypothetical protein [uncultured bacterium]KKU34885.1 MAG: hypothetical protein UX50_C0009G0012 [Candidatus Beckwithbacteria bacterium GW2011_GWA1_46_30]KKU60479.1 MAG: hypothetical protein UX85_C0010G0012 [Candidatus Beckwithbacteria bacterium GW2011_GWB1_47_15]KKU72354.1 MAG: hypothetical protein UX97_C0001G0224 [Candidatus Beckwithbacteria bacterium GW2011_GWA2_47_25]OGD48246.
MKLDKMVLANAFGLATAILWVVCSLMVALLPNFSWEVMRWWMHGMDVDAMGGWNLNLFNFLAGGLTLVITAWVTGYIFGWSWEKVSRK